MSKTAGFHNSIFRQEFLKYLRAESEDYLESWLQPQGFDVARLHAANAEEKGFKGIYTGRRMQFTDGKLAFDGDFQTIGDNLIYGIMAAVPWHFLF